MDAYQPHLKHMTARIGRHCDLLRDWINIDTRSAHTSGLEIMLDELQRAFSGLGGAVDLPSAGAERAIGARGKEIIRPLGSCLRMIKRPAASLRVLLSGHMDAVLGPQLTHPMAGILKNEDKDKDIAEDKDEGQPDKLFGPGALDGKGGLAVMLAALECLESFPPARNLGWEVLIVPDEEIGSPGSAALLRQAAGRSHLGLLFEPALADGDLVAARSGSGNFTLVVHGRAAHAGRQPEAGRNAIDALADFIVALRQLTRRWPGMRVNVGAVEGGGPVNVVPDLALCRFNIRVGTDAEMGSAEAQLSRIIETAGAADGISLELHGGFRRPPKLLDRPTGHILESLAACGREIGCKIRWHATGGVCDGNILAAAGLPNVDSLGPIGGGMHTPEEYVLTASILERAQLTALFLMKLAAGEIAWPPIIEQ